MASKVFKIIGIVILAIVLCGCIGVDSWYIYVLKFAPDKVIANTYEIGLQETTNGDANYFVELNYFSNAKQNGLEMLEIKYNYMLDEKQEAFYSQGLQYVANDKTSKLDFEYKMDASQSKGVYLNTNSGWYNGNDNYGFFGSYQVNNKAKKYNYSSGNDYVTPTISTNPLGLNTRFKVQAGNDLFLMKFKNNDTEMTSENYIYKADGTYHFYLVYGRQDINYYYTYYDYNYFSKLMYEVVKSVTPGTTKSLVFEFGDLFDYYKYDESTKTYSDTKYKNCDSVIQEMKSYYSIKVNVSENGAQKSSDSIFNIMHGTTTYNLTGNYSSDDYFYGRNIVKLNIYNFDFVNISDNFYAIKLKKDIANFYKNYNIYLKIEIDLDILETNNMVFTGVTADSGLDDFKIQEFYTLKTLNGEVIKTEVEI